MKSIRETVASGINTLPELREALQTAIQLEFSTIPPYLCAEWSINVDPDNVVGDIIHSVVIQEMLHFGFACNMLTAIGGSPAITNPYFIPTYPGPLPGGVHPGLIVDLLPLGLPSLTTFLQIEYPENGSVIPQPPPPTPPPGETIGAFYDTIAEGFQAVFPTGQFPDPVKNQVTTDVDGDPLFSIDDVAAALKAIDVIKDQGEGTSVDPNEGTADPDELAHYYAFSQVYFGKTLKKDTSGKYQYGDPAIAMPTVWPFGTQSGDQTAFIKAFSDVLTQLQACWTSGADINTAITTMFVLKTAGTTLIKAGVRPQFSFHSSP